MKSARSRLLGAVAALSVLVTACGGGAAVTSAGDAEPYQELSVRLGEPEHLVTLNAAEFEGLAVLKALYTPLVTYDPDTSEPTDGVAESITTEDGGVTWTVALQPGWTFHNGEEVTADSFIDAWNYGAYAPNAMRNNGYFSDIEGYDALNPVEDNQAPAAETLSGLERLDDHTFKVTLSRPETFWPQKLGYAAFAPLPQAFFEDPEAFAEQPIGNGPFKMAEPWQHDDSIRVTRYDDWAGEPAPAVDEIEFRIYADVNTAVTDLLAGNLDVVTDVPTERWQQVTDELGVDRTLETPGSDVTFLGFPMLSDSFGGDDNVALRQALSQAIDREAIATAIFDGNVEPASNLLPPPIPGHETEACDAWTHDPDRARELYAESEPVEEPLTVWFNAGGGQDAWIEAVTNQWRDVLGIEKFEFKSLQPADYLPLLGSDELDGPYRLGWSMDYPHPQNYLEPLLASWMSMDAGGMNTFRYADDEFDAELETALAISDLDEAVPAYQQAVTTACEDVPLIPVYYGEGRTAFGEDVANVHVDASGALDYLTVTTS